MYGLFITPYANGDVLGKLIGRKWSPLYTSVQNVEVTPTKSSAPYTIT